MKSAASLFRALPTAALLVLSLGANAWAASLPLGEGYVDIEESTPDVRVHVWETEDSMRSAVLAVESKTGVVAVESPSFVKDFPIWRDYLTKLGKPLAALLVSSHPGSGSAWYGDAPTLATEVGREAITSGSPRAIADGLKAGYGDAFEAQFLTIEKTLPKDAPVDIAGIRVIAHDASDGTIFVFPALKTAYIHMLSHDYHSILPGKAAAEGYIADLEYLKRSGVKRICSSHHEPEDASVIDAKIAYVRDVIRAAESSKTADDFKAAVKAQHPSLKGDAYLDMTAAGFFPAKH